jgi:hypothetical protein
MDTRAGSAVQPPLSQAVGYVIVVVLGLIVAGGECADISYELR